MGQPKQALLVEGVPLLTRTVDVALQVPLDQVIVVLGYQAERMASLLEGRSVHVVINSSWEEGVASSIRTGLMAVHPQAQAAFFIPADLPRLTVTPLRVVMSAYATQPAPIVVPTYQGQRGNPVLFDREVFAELLALRGDQGGRVLFPRYQGRLSYIEVGSPEILIDVDTPEDYPGQR
jgi:molybdenum cofactor cytidylyltransferase